MPEKLTPTERTQGREQGTRTRRERATARQAQVKIMLEQGKTKAEIARHFKVAWETIARDCKAIAKQTPRATVSSIVDGVLAITRKEVTGEISTLEAREQIETLIRDAAKAEREIE